MIFRKSTVNFLAKWQKIRCYQNLSRLDLHPKVQDSLNLKQPVVALESTIITHGMPYPQNVETAREVEEMVRSHGAVPATIAIIDGRIKVGLTEQELTMLGSTKPEDITKSSRRDLPYVLSRGQCGGTTVAATMIIAHMVGIRVLATGGIGGVHREGHISMDVSADLVELGRTPLTVVCSGVKSILDIPRTLEYLETQGVCVATYGEAQGRFPDFYTRDSGCRVPYNLADATEAAHLIKTLHEIQLQSGILIGVPIPEAYAVDKQLIDDAIGKACLEMKQRGISGKHVTPFLLAAIVEITKGNSLKANIALIKNNASVAADIARELCRNESYAVTLNQSKTPLVVGASILDLSLTMLDGTPNTLDGATYHAKTKQSAGGVGRNLAEGLFKLNGKTNFISAVGNDQLGKILLSLMPEPLREKIKIDGNNATSLCSVIFDKMGDCKLILGNMEIHQTITAEGLQKNEDLFHAAPLIVFDANLSLPTMESILKLAAKHQRPVFYEPTDMRFAAKPFSLPLKLTKQIKIISPNLHELKTIVETIKQTSVPWDIDIGATTKITDCLEKIKELIVEIQDHFDCILVTLGKHGVILNIRGEKSHIFEQALFNSEGKYCMPDNDSTRCTRFYAAPRVENINNVSGAGDSFSVGFIAGLLRGYKVENCVALGFTAAGRALQSHSAVPDKYFVDASEETNILKHTLETLQKIDM